MKRSLPQSLFLCALFGYGCVDAPATPPKLTASDPSAQGVRTDIGGPRWERSSARGTRSRSRSAALIAETSELPSLAGVRIAYDMSHDTGRQSLSSPTGGNANSEIFADYVARGASIEVLTSFTAEALAGVTVLWLEEDFNTPLSPAEKLTLSGFVTGGGSVVLCCEDWATGSSDPASPLGVFGFGYSPGSLSGTTTRIVTHSATAGVSSVAFGTSVRSLAVPPEGTTLVFDESGSNSAVAVRDFGSGRVAVLADELCIDGTVDLAGNRRLCNNLLSFLTGTQIVHPDEPATVTTTENGVPVAGIDIPAGTFDKDVTVTVRFVSTDQSAPCHAYLLGQVGRCLHISATADGENVTNLKPMTAGLCLPANLGPRELFKFEDRQDTPVALRQTMVPFLDCTGFQLGSAERTGGLKGLAMDVARSVGHWFAPAPLYAAHGGFGGQLLAGDGLSFFTWASPLEVSNAGLAVNVRRSGKDAYALAGTFKLQPELSDPFPGESGFTPATEAVTVAFGANEYTIPGGSFRYSPLFRRWIYAAHGGSGVTAMSIDTHSGRFIIAATVPTAGGLPVDKPFSLRIGNRTQGLLLECGTRGACLPQEPPE